MERFVQSIVGGGLATVAGLWLTRFAAGRVEAWAVAVWWVGLVLVTAGVVALAAGIVHEVELGAIR